MNHAASTTRSRGRRTTAAVTVVGLAVTMMSVTAVAASAAGGGYTASLIQTPAPGPVLAVDSATDTVYLGTTTGVVVVNAATNSVTTTIATPAPVNAIAVDSATNTVYLAASPTSGAVIDVINGATNTVTTSISVPAGITGLAVDDATNTLYATQGALAQLTVIAGATNTVTTTFSTGIGTLPYHLAVDQTSDMVWLADERGSLIAIDGATNTIAKNVALSGTLPLGIAVSQSTDTVYVSDTRNSQIIALNGATDATITQIPVGPLVNGVAVDQSSDVVYAASSYTTTGITWVINGSTNQITDSIARGSSTVAVDQATGIVYEPALRQAAVFIMSPAGVNSMSPVITSAASLGFIVGNAGSFSVTASALPAASFAETGPLPSGLTMSASGVLSGTPAAGTGGLYPVTVTASNGVAPDYSQQLDVIAYQAPAITSGGTATFQVGTAGSFPLTATGYTAPSFTYSGSLPAGLSITDQTPAGWQISGTPAVGTGGVYPITVLAYNSVSPEAQQAFTLTVNEAPSITSAGAATLQAGTSGSFFMTSLGYPAPTFTETGKLPAGVTLNSAGVLSGTPAATAGGVYPITITASNGIAPDASRSFSLTVNQRPAFTSPSRISWGTVRRHTFTFRTTGFPAATLSERGALPSGVTFKAGPGGTAVLAGRPPRADRGKTYVITVTARNGVGAAVRQTFRLTIV